VERYKDLEKLIKKLREKMRLQELKTSLVKQSQ